jgi:16S rRNA A1518/A1519 N6-dimethyltransferase RsmA/KsgA/DIM1 with predicted DNA glycosylase/AP lyase activity
LFKFIKLAFSSPRKKLLHNLLPLKSKEALASVFDELKISTDVRPADLHLDDYHKLFSELVSK